MAFGIKYNLLNSPKKPHFPKSTPNIFIFKENSILVPGSGNDKSGERGQYEPEYPGGSNN